MSDLMDDTQDFGWNPAKASHTVLLCSMEEGKISWQDTSKIDRIRRTHVQRATTSQTTHNPRKSKMTMQTPANFIKISHVHKKGTIRQGVRITNMFVPFVMLMAANWPILPNNVDWLDQPEQIGHCPAAVPKQCQNKLNHTLYIVIIPRCIRTEL